MLHHFPKQCLLFFAVVSRLEEIEPISLTLRMIDTCLFLIDELHVYRGLTTARKPIFDEILERVFWTKITNPNMLIIKTHFACNINIQVLKESKYLNNLSRKTL